MTRPMKNHLVATISPLVLLTFAACGGGDTPAAGGGAAGGGAASGAGATPTPAPVKVEEPAKQETKKPVARPRIDYDTVKRMFGGEPGQVPDAPIASTPDLVALGKALYHEKHLSKNGNISCASCHDLSTYGVDNKPTSPGTDGKNGERNTPTTYNAFRQFKQFWDGRADSVEAQATGPVTNPIEHGLADEAQLVAKIKDKAELVDGFKKAFPGEADAVTAENFRRAVGAFERTLVTKSRWDEYLDGNQKALTNEELVGLDTFLKVGCITCHVNRTLGGHMFQKTGLVKPYSSPDTGREQVTKSETDRFLFKVPNLVNVEKTAPYLHDGKMATLEEAVHLMGEMQLGQSLKPEQVDAIVTFLKSTTGALPAEFAAKK